MPNWVLNKVHFIGNKKDIEKLKKLVVSDKCGFDFNRIIPMPEDLRLDHGSSDSISMAFAEVKRKHGKNWKSSAEFRKLIEKYHETSWLISAHTYDEWAEIGERYLTNKQKYGYTTWYDWCCDKWGTKWNACDEHWEGNDLQFSTAWSMPEPVFEKLAELFPGVTIEVSFADEDLGNNCGQALYNEDEPGNNVVEYIDTLEFACDVWGYDAEEIRSECCYE